MLPTLLSCLLILVVSHDLDDDDPAIVTTKYGKLRGIVDSQGRQFLKVPYADKPLNDNRWKPPQPLPAWNTTDNDTIYDATQQMPGCMQQSCGEWFLCPKIIQEDCLYMNIYTPLPAPNNATTNTTELLPVFLFIHGGSFIHYYGGAYVGNSTTLANMTNIIACLINYRLGAFGFYYNEDLNITGNYGYYDQKAALRWVKDNIEAFGGDPNNIIIGGESAGGQSVTLLTVDPSNDGLYTAAIVESNPVSVPYRTPATWHEIPTAFIAASKCNIFNNDHEKELQCLRSRDSKTLLEAQDIAVADGAAYINNSLHDVEPWPPTVGGIDGLFEDQPQFLYRDGKFNKDVPMIIGTNRDEFSLFLYAIWNKNTTLPAWELWGFMNGLIGEENTDKAFEYYNISIVSNHTEDMRHIGSQMLTDATFRCPSRYLQQMITKYSNSNGYFYHFNHPSSFNEYAYGSIPACYTEVCHAAELPYVFRVPLWPINVNASYTEYEWNLSEMFQWYWSNMGKMGNPGQGTFNNQNGVEWKSFDDGNTMILDTPPPDGGGVRVINGFDDSPCDFWDTLDYNWNY